MINWIKHLQTISIMPTIPAHIIISSEVRTSYDTYHFYGKTRNRTTHIALFQYTLDGEGCFENKKGSHRLKKGTGFFCDVLDPETAYYYPKDRTLPWRFLYIFFDGSFALSMLKDINSRYGHVFQLPENKGIIQKIIGFSGKSERQIMITPSQSLSLLTELINALLKSKEENIKSPSGNTLIERFQQEIELHINENINVSQIAAHLDISREHISRVFREEMRTTPHEFLQNYKMRLACHLLKESSSSIKEVSHQLGFDQPGHFTRTFKRAIGLSPRDFRENGDLTSYLT